MSVFLTNNNGKFSFSYITGDGILTTNNGEITKVDHITETDLSEELQSKLSSIDTISGEITTIQSNITSIENTIANLGDGLTLDSIVPVVNDLASSTINNFAKQWYTAVNNTSNPNIINIACSGDGKSIFVCPWSVGSAQFSTDYGQTWSTPSNVSANIWSCAMNLDGQYIVLADNNNYKVSTDYGVTFNIPTSRPFSLQQASLSATGKYIACACSSSQGLQVSSDYGATWTQRETSTNTWTFVAIATDGSIIYGSSDNGIIKKSINYGSSWSTIYTNGSSSSIKTLCCSGDGKYVMATFNSSAQILLSSDYGSNFNFVGDTAAYYSSAMSKNGMYMIAAVNGTYAKYSTNYGVNWSTVSSPASSSNFTAVAMSYNGEAIYNVSPYNKVIISNNTNNIIGSEQPAIPTSGSNYFDTGTNRFYIYNGTAWKSITLT